VATAARHLAQEKHPKRLLRMPSSPLRESVAAGNLGRTPAHQRLAFLSRSTAGQAGGLCPYIRGKNAGELQAEASPQRSGLLPSAFATCAPSGQCNQSPEQSADCSTLDGQRPATRFELEVLWPGDPYGHLPVDANTALLRLLIRSGAWAWVHAFSTSQPSIVLRNRPLSNSVRICESVYFAMRSIMSQGA